mmetsp:Transcript_26779/g.46163  ORF Transcript_26779/g.46163 Transcript_26779/m.46163 type:complete len:335 (-) Transcript_26779:957-1961(-)
MCKSRAKKNDGAARREDGQLKVGHASQAGGVGGQQGAALRHRSDAPRQLLVQRMKSVQCSASGDGGMIRTGGKTSMGRMHPSRKGDGRRSAGCLATATAQHGNTEAKPANQPFAQDPFGGAECTKEGGQEGVTGRSGALVHGGGLPLRRADCWQCERAGICVEITRLMSSASTLPSRQRKRQTLTCCWRGSDDGPLLRGATLHICGDSTCGERATADAQRVVCCDATQRSLPRTWLEPQSRVQQHAGALPRERTYDRWCMRMCAGSTGARRSAVRPVDLHSVSSSHGRSGSNRVDVLGRKETRRDTAGKKRRARLWGCFGARSDGLACSQLSAT